MGKNGRVMGIYIAPHAEAEIVSVESVRAVAGRGLEGDRYFDSAGTWSANPGTGREVTLIEYEAVEAARRDYGLDLAPGQARRNLVTAGIALNHLVGKEFMVGEARMRGMRLCEPCSHLARLSRRGVVRALIHRGGLRADIVSGGDIRVGDRIRP